MVFFFPQEQWKTIKEISDWSSREDDLKLSFDMSPYPKSEMYRSFFSSGGVRILGALSIVTLTVLLGRYFGAKAVGVFYISHAILLAVNIIAKFGIPQALMRSISHFHGGFFPVKPILFALLFVFVTGISLAFLCQFMRPVLNNIFSNPELTHTTLIMLLGLPALAITYVSSGFFKGLRRPAVACLFENGFVSFCCVIALLFVLTLSLDVAIFEVAYIYVACSWAVACLALTMVTIFCFRYGRKNSDYQFYHKILTPSASFFLIEALQYSSQFSCILIAGIFLSQHDVGLFKAAEQLAVAPAFVLVVANIIFPPRFATLYYQNNMVELKKLSVKSAKITFSVAFPFLLILALFPELAMRIVGEDFIDARNLLLALVIAQMVNVATGSVSGILAMSGHEKILRNITAAIAIISIVMNIVLIRQFGVLGAAIGYSSAVVMQNLAASVFVWKKMRILSLPMYVKSNV